MVHATHHGCSSSSSSSAKTNNARIDGPEQHDEVMEEEEREEEEEEYQPCGHVLPEAWPERLLTILGYEKEGILEPHHFLGVLGEQAWFIPKFTAERDPSLTSWFGLSGERNRRKVATTFKRPTTWKEYCDQISTNGCNGSIDNGDGGGEDIQGLDSSIGNSTSSPTSTPVGDVVVVAAVRPPQDDTEGSKYYVEGLYTGYFRDTDEGDCDKYPTNCTGHFADFPCDWSR